MNPTANAPMQVTAKSRFVSVPLTLNIKWNAYPPTIPPNMPSKGFQGLGPGGFGLGNPVPHHPTSDQPISINGKLI
jgi:hypothetical protein